MDTTEFQSKMLIAFFKAFKIEPSVPGIIRAFDAEPEAVFEAIRTTAAAAPHAAAAVEAIPRLIQLVIETHALQLENNQMLRQLLHAVEPPRTIPLQIEAAEG